MPTEIKAHHLIPSHDQPWLQHYADQSHETNVLIYQRYPQTPAPCDWGVVFDLDYEVFIWFNLLALISNGRGNCNDIAPAVSAYLQVKRGIKSRPLVIPQPNDSSRWHCTTITNGSEYDPNYYFGMKRG